MFLNDITYSTSLCDDGVLLSFSTLANTGNNSNISPANIYLIEFSEELTIPSGNTVEISPSGYSLTNVSNFTPQCFIKIKSEYADGSQTVVKLTVKDANYNILKTQYKRVLCSSNQIEKPCIVPTDQPLQQQYVTLSIRNNWEHSYNGYLIAKFVPNDVHDDIKVKLPRKDITYLPSRGQNDQIKVTILISKLKEYNFTPEQIKTLLGGNAAFNTKNKNYIFVVDSLGRTISQIENIQVGTVPQGTGSNPLPILIKNLGSVEFNTAKPAPVPTAAIVKWTHSSTTTTLGELILNPDTYQNNDEIIILYDNDTITGMLNHPLLLLTS